jgi:diadenosine tetraphosphatase ApaH/serine/threonine PP2A family protein phosphatase|mmetsp:Transcript_82965/g.138485  ORF Transcript_82965/g.138485 Transcript_82965/m.138485 type:complete len:455 (-) Transcript_82965:2025-3389(-)|eukprot:CAMPEP_0174297368 /NCGR_PEP_ID=MMETSP0809-20121228/50820_1 /TAXON_ID=73025 ORGANISM="Eutreptiella gymnastica-like, Strain CCMP1594" /NCGR_SAMPLE_ID=MMETSP0809 /ASSEMBLY_ACC=CAM_ASM_000658 /LENGTH=454 /DNA_ID=CAMNT_0015401137 /DNA_START=52 /DNA_END=1416 /DNA_ORIENTATION=+
MSEKTATKPFKISQKMLVIDDVGVQQKKVLDVIKDQAAKDKTNPMLVGSLADMNSVLERLESEFPQYSRAEVGQLVCKPSQWILNYLDECYFPDNEDGIFHHTDLNTFAACINTLCVNIDPTTAILDLKSPVYVLGDIHGNYKDLNYLSKNVIQFNNLKYSAANLLFLGDYVDRGPYSVETAAWILAMRARFPLRVHVLRGNHEFYSVNGDESTYSSGSFFAQCKELWGARKGESIWNDFNTFFDGLAMGAIVDNRVFCVHGGIPRPLQDKNKDPLMLLRDPDFPIFTELWPHDEDDATIRDQRQVASDMVWGDPAPEEQEAFLDENGFGPNLQRDPTGRLPIFGNKAIDQFLQRHKFDFIIRAHEIKGDGLQINKHARVITVFSSSGYCGADNGSAMVYINEGKLRFVLCSLTANRKRTGAAGMSRTESEIVAAGRKATARSRKAPGAQKALR